MSHTQSYRSQEQCESEWRRMIGTGRSDRSLMALRAIPLGRPTNRFWFVLFVTLVCCAVGLCREPATVAMAQEISEADKATETAGQNGNGVTQESRSVAEEADQNKATEQTVVNKMWLPAVLPDGRRITPIGMYQSQMDELVPDDYRPVSLEQLNQAIAKWTARATDDQTSRLKGAVYWVRVADDTLVSENSILDIESDRTGQVRRSLGKLNLPINQPQGFSPGNTTVPRMESESNGNLVAVFRGAEELGGSSEIRYSWDMRGTKAGNGYVFNLKIPRAPQATFYFSMPVGTSLRADQGVLRQLSEAPAEASKVAEVNDLNDGPESNQAVDLSWYELDAGGLDAVTIQTQIEEPNSASGSFVIRRSAMKYEADRLGLNWTCNMVVQVSDAWQLPELFVGDAGVTSIAFGTEEIQFLKSETADYQGQWKLSFLNESQVDTDGLLDVVVKGYSRWDSSQRWCELPMPVWVGDTVVHGTVVDEAVLSVREPLQVLNWALPQDWQWESQSTQADVTTVAVKGPGLASDFDLVTSKSRAKLMARSQWSRVQLVDRAVFTRSEAALQLNVVDGRLRGKARIEIKVHSNRLEPVTLLVQGGWVCESITLQHSGRVIEDPRIRAGELVFWPEDKDVRSATILLEVEGSADLIQESNAARRLKNEPNAILKQDEKNNLAANRPRNAATSVSGKPDTNRVMATRVPASWFVRSKQARGTMIAAVTPPKDLNWSGEVAMQRGAVDLTSLTQEQQSFFSGLSPETLWFQPASGRTPELLLLKPSVSFNAKTSFDVRRLGEEVFETLKIEIQSDGLFRERLQVQTGSLKGRGEFLWSIRDSADGTTIGLPASDVSEVAGAYSIDLSERNLRGRKLIARRTYKIPLSIEMQLPIVSGASSQNAVATIGEGLLVSQKPPDVQRIPTRTSAWNSQASFEGIERSDAGEIDAGETEAGETEAGETNSGETEAGETGIGSKSAVSREDEPSTAFDGSTKLRYDAIQSSFITVRRSDINPSVTIVWRQQIRVEASSRGTDRIEATFRVSPTAPLVISYEPELQLESVERDNVPIDLMAVQRRPLILEPRSDTETIRVVWNRSQYGPSWMRDCKLPKIDVSGTVLKSEYHLMAASDTFAPLALIRGDQGGQGIAAVIAMQSGESTTLVRRNIALAIGWLLALLTFAVCWFISERSPSLVAGIVVVFTAVLILWWPWKLAVIGWLIIPAVTAAILATSRSWSGYDQSADNPSQTGGGISRRSKDVSKEFSIDSAARILGLLIAISLFLSAAVVAQEESAVPEEPKSAERLVEVNVLVPMDKNGKHRGSMVYIPGKIHSQLFERVNRLEPKDARIAVADYRVNLQPDLVKAGKTDGLSVEADYLIHLEDGEQGTNVVRLPIPHNSVRNVDLLGSANSRMRYDQDKNGWTIVTLPAAEYVRIRLTLQPAVSVNAPWVKVAVAIPPVASSRLVVQSEQNVSALRVAGRLLEETELRRWKENLGPSREMAIEFRTLLTAKTDVARKLGRRYRVNAGRRQVTIECEVDPPGLIAEGETFQFDIRDSSMPRITTRDWRLESSELKSSNRRQMILTCLKDAPGPIGLLWTFPSTIADEQFTDSSEIQIPEVTATFGNDGDAWLALYSDSNLQFSLLEAKPSDTFSVDDFNKSWRGFPEKINDRAYVISGELPSLVLSERLTRPPEVIQQHDLKVLRDRLELTYSATLDPGTDYSQRYSLRLPKNLELLNLTVNGETLSVEPIMAAEYIEIPLTGSLREDPADLSEMQIEAVGVHRFNWRSRTRFQTFTPPRMTLTPEIETADQYRISHDRSTTLSAIDLPLQALADPRRSFTEQSLAEGWISEASWVIPVGTEVNPTSLGGRYRVTKRSDAFDCDQEIILDRFDGVWRMEIRVDFLSGSRPEFVDVEIPSRWCQLDTLRVENSRLWTRQPSVDPSRQIIRIALDLQNPENQELVIQGQLVGAESARVSVPSVRVLGRGKRRVMINVPSRLENEKLQWREQAVKAVRTSKKNRAKYECQRPSWTVDLAPLPEVDVEPELFGVDVEVFPQNDGVLVLSHWDLFPGGLDSVVVELPPETTLLAAWAAGRAVVAETVEETDGDEQATLVRVPLALTRLGQPIEVLLEASAAVARRGEYLPRLKEIQNTDRWVTHYAAASPLDPERENPAGFSERGLSLARAVVESVESLDRLSQRPTAEIAAWLQLWLKRYWMIAEASGHAVRFTAEVDSADSMLTSPFNRQYNQPITIADQERWKELDTRMGVFVDRFLSKKEIRETRDARFFLFDVGGFGGFYPQTVVDLVANESVPTVKVASERDSGLRNLIVNSITLLVIIALLTCIGPLQRFVVPVVRHPAFWLALVGVFGFAVAPVPVAGAILLVAVALPVFPARRTSLSR